MTSKEVTSYIEGLIGKHVPYKKDPPFSIEEGFNCFGWVMFLVNKINNEQNDIFYDIEKLKILETVYHRVKDPPRFLDVPLFYLNTLDSRHIGLMLDEYTFTQCSELTNGISILDINRAPWNIFLKAIYRRK